MLAFARLDLERFGGHSKYTHARDILSDDLRGKHGDGACIHSCSCSCGTRRGETHATPGSR